MNDDLAAGGRRLGQGRSLPRDWRSGLWVSATVSPEIVRHGLNHSRPALSVPARAATPSDTTRTALVAKSAGASAL